MSKIKIDVVKAGEYAPGAFRYCFDITTNYSKPIVEKPVKLASEAIVKET